MKTAVLLLSVLLVAVQSQQITGIGQVIQILRENIHNIEVEASVGTNTTNSSCYTKLMSLYDGLKVGNSNSTYFFDALGKPQSGILTGNSLMMGDYDLCLKMKKGTQGAFIPCKSTANAFIVGNPKAIPYTWTTCLPAECQDVAFDEAINITLNNTLLHKYLKINSKTACPMKIDYDVGAYIAVVLVSVIVFLVMVGTLWEPIIFLVRSFSSPDDTVLLVTDYEEEEPGPSIDRKKSIQHNLKGNGPQRTILGRIMYCFSLQKNVPAFLSTDTKEGQVLCLNGIRILSINWVVLGHMYLWPAGAAGDTMSYLFGELFVRKSFLLVSNALPSVDSFFVLSGFLVSYLLLKDLTRNDGKFQAVVYYVHRYIRLTIPFLLVTLIEGFLYPVYITGNFSEAFKQEHETCKQYWWTNLLYINNLYPWTKVELCVAQTWYLSNDMQFFFLAPIFIIALWHRPKIGNALVQVAIWASAIGAGWITYHYKFGPSTITDTNQNNFRYLYRVPWVRCTPYLIGILGGWIYWCWSDVIKRWSSHQPAWRKLLISVVIWTATIAIEYAVVFGLYDVTKYPAHRSTLKSVSYESLARISWSIALMVQIFACQFGFGGWINTCLSWRGLLPLSRLTYAVYLLHFGIGTAFATQLRHPFFYKTDFEVAIIYLGILIISYAASVLMYVMVEQPVGFLERMSYRKS